MNMFKKNGGFTLVELIVVIAILAILAAVAVPAYNGYIGQANDSAVESEMVAALTAAQAAAAMGGDVLDKVVVDTDGTVTAYIVGSDDAIDITEFFDGKINNVDKHSDYKTNGATWEDGAWGATPAAGGAGA